MTSFLSLGKLPILKLSWIDKTSELRPAISEWIRWSKRPKKSSIKGLLMSRIWPRSST